MQRNWILLAAGIPMLIAPMLAVAPEVSAWPHDPHQNAFVCTAIWDQHEPYIVSDGDGGSIIAWRDKRNGSDFDIYAQRLSPEGEPLWPPDGVPICDAPNSQYVAAMVTDSTGGAIIAWYDQRNPSPGIYVQRVDETGMPLWTDGGELVAEEIGDRESPAMLPDWNSGAILVWTDYRSGNGDLYVQKVDQFGTMLLTPNGSSFVVEPGDQASYGIAPDGAGGVYIPFEDYSGTDVDLYCQYLDPGAALHYPGKGIVLSTAGNDQNNPVIAPDGLGGAIVAWVDGKSGTSDDIYAQRVTAASGALWNTHGNVVCADSAFQESPLIVSDGAGGAIIAWEDWRPGLHTDIYAQRVNVAGYTQWTNGGEPVTQASGYQFPAYMTRVDDGVNGAIITWADERTGDRDIYAQRINPNGCSEWAGNGVALCTAPFDQDAVKHISDGAGGAIAVWQDPRKETEWDIHAQNVETYGHLGSPSPILLGVQDVPNDQGGKVKLTWGASYLDAPAFVGLEEYWIWREAPPVLVLNAVAGGAKVANTASTVMELRQSGHRAYLALPDHEEEHFWEYVGSQPAGHLSSYSYVASTTSDSVEASNPTTAFMLQIWIPDTGATWYSNHLDGYSVDDLAPAAPAPFSGEYLSGSTALHWGVSPEGDFLEYRLYRDKNPAFVPNGGSLVVAQSDTGYVDTAGEAYFYKLSAVDIHGNESPFAFLQPDGTVGIEPDPDLPLHLALYPSVPNPVCDQAVIRFDLPTAATVILAIYDARGRLVRHAIDRLEIAGGRHEWVWDGRDTAGARLTAGMYFIRLETPQASQTRKAVILE